MRRNPQQGVTLVELVITIVIISTAIAGVVGAFALITGRSADPLIQSRATALGQLYLDEILARNYDLDTPPGGVPRFDGGCRIQGEPDGDRDRFRAVDQYDGIDDSPSFVAEEFGQTYTGFRVRIDVTCAGDELSLAQDDAKRIDVTVTDSRGQETQISAYRSNF